MNSVNTRLLCIDGSSDVGTRLHQTLFGELRATFDYYPGRKTDDVIYIVWSSFEDSIDRDMGVEL